MVESLESIIRRKQRSKQKYEQRYSVGSFERKELAPYYRRRVKVSGIVVACEDVRFTLRDVNIRGVQLDHINTHIDKGTKEYRKLFSLLDTGKRVTFTAIVYKYRSGVRHSYGIRSVKGIKCNDKGSKDIVAPKKHLSVFAQPYSKIRFDGVIVKGSKIEDEGFVDLRPELKQFTSKPLSILEDSVNIKLHQLYNVLSSVESEISSYIYSSNPWDIAYIGSFLSTKFRKFTEHGLRNRLISSRGGWSIPTSITDQIICNTTRFIEKWSKGQGYSVSRCCPKDAGMYATPVSFISSDSNHVLIVIPYIKRSVSYSWSEGSIAGLVGRMSLRRGVRVTIYNPIANRYISLKRK